MKPDACPCCASADIHLHDNDWAEPPLWSAHCAGCGLSTKEYATREEAIAAWNKRAPLGEPAKAAQSGERMAARDAVIDPAVLWRDERSARAQHAIEDAVDRLTGTAGDGGAK